MAKLALVFIVVFSLILEGAALYYQYVLDYGPCILCVQIRATLFLITGFALIMLLFLSERFSLRPAALLSGVGLGTGTLVFIYQTYQILGIERGWFEGVCTFEPPFPSWIPLHEILPSVFEAWELCGYTPEIVAGITMAESLMAVGALYLLLTLISLAALVKYSRI